MKSAMRLAILLTGCLILAPLSGYTQTRGYAAGLAGITFQSESDAVVGGEIGLTGNENVDLYAGVTAMRNVLAPEVQDALDELGERSSIITGQTWKYSSSMRAVVAAAGVRIHGAFDSWLRPYVAGGAGVANLKFKLTQSGPGATADDLAEVLGVESAATKFYLEAGGGLESTSGPFFLDLGYRYAHVDQFDISRVYLSVGRRF